MKSIALFAALALPGALFAADPVVGSWKLNVALSKPFPGRAFPTAATATIALHGDTYEVSGTQTYADGKSISGTFTVSTAGGVLRPTAGTLPPGTVRTMKRIDERAVDFIDTRDGKPVLTVHVTVSPDGKSMQRALTGVDAQGKAFEVREVYDKQ